MRAKEFTEKSSRRYGHVSNHMSQNAADKMEKFIGTL